MATATVAHSHHGTLSGTTVDTVTIEGAHEEVEVIERSGTSDLYVTADGSTPTSGGANTEIVLAGTACVIKASAGEGGTVVKVLGNGNAYSVGEV